MIPSRHLLDIVTRLVQATAGVMLLMLCVFIDGTHLSNDGGHKALPVYITSGNIDNTVARKVLL